VATSQACGIDRSILRLQFFILQFIFNGLNFLKFIVKHTVCCSPLSADKLKADGSDMKFERLIHVVQTIRIFNETLLI
jgi:hypothetical protein